MINFLPCLFIIFVWSRTSSRYVYTLIQIYLLFLSIFFFFILRLLLYELGQPCMSTLKHRHAYLFYLSSFSTCMLLHRVDFHVHVRFWVTKLILWLYVFVHFYQKKNFFFFWETKKCYVFYVFWTQAIILRKHVRRPADKTWTWKNFNFK